MSDSAEAADRLSARRVRVMTAVMIIFAAQSARPPVDMPQRTVEYAAMATAIVGAVVASLTAMPSVFAFRMVILAGMFVATMRFVRLERDALA